MRYNLSELPINTKLICKSGENITITGEPIGFGGTSIVYPAIKDNSCLKLAVKEFTDINNNSLAKINKEMKISIELYNSSHQVIPIREILNLKKITFPSKNKTAKHKKNKFGISDSLKDKSISLYELKQICSEESENKNSRSVKTGGLPKLYTSAQILLEVLYILKFIHEKEYIHGDINLKNIFFSSYDLENGNVGTALAIDFGCSYKLNSDGFTEVLKDENLFSTPGFTPPELIERTEEVKLSRSSDIYSAGRIFLFLLKGTDYVSNLGIDRVHSEQSLKTLIPLDCARINCSKPAMEKTNNILIKSLQDEPANRYSDVNLMINDLCELINFIEVYDSLKIIKYNINADFVNNVTTMDKLKEKVCEANSPVFLTGFAGLGKTTLVKKFAQDYQKDSIGNVYFATYTKSMLHTIAKNLTIFCESKQKEILEKNDKEAFEEVFQALEQLKANDIIVIDNFDTGKNNEFKTFDAMQNDPYFLKIKYNLETKLIITTRMQISAEQNVVEIEKLSEADLLTLMKKYYLKWPSIYNAESDLNNDLYLIIDKIEQHTLTAKLIALTLQNMNTLTPKKILNKIYEVLRGDSKEVTLSEISMEVKGQQERKKLDEFISMLFDISDLNSNEISVLILSELMPKYGMDYGLFLSGVGTDLEKDLRSLIQKGWIEHDEINDILTIHTLISNLIKKQNEFKYNDINKFLTNLYNVSGLEEKNHEKWHWYPQIEASYSIGISIFEDFKNTAEEAKLCDWYANYSRILDMAGDVSSGKEFIELAIKLQEEFFKEDYEKKARYKSFLGHSYGTLGDHKNSLKYKEESLQIKLEYLNNVSNLDSICTSYSEVGFTCGKIGQINKDKTYLEKALQNKVKALELTKQMYDAEKNNENTVKLAKRYDDVGYFYNLLDKNVEALEAINNGYELKKEICRGDANKTILEATYFNRAKINSSLNLLDEALSDMKLCLDLRKERIITGNKTLLGTTYKELGIIYGKMGLNEAAFENLKMAKEIYESVKDCDKNRIKEVENILKEMETESN